MAKNPKKLDLDKKLSKSKFDVSKISSKASFIKVKNVDDKRKDYSKTFTVDSVAKNISLESSLPEFEITGFESHIMSYDEQLKLKVLEINSDQPEGQGSVNDPSLGTISRDQICETCHGNYITCKGHYAIIKLNHFFLNPIVAMRGINVLQCVCNSCGKGLLSRQICIEKGFFNLPCHKRIEEMAKYISEGNFSCDNCKLVNCKYFPSELKKGWEVYCQLPGDNQPRQIKSIQEIEKIYNEIPQEDLENMGFKGKSSPKNWILKAIIVPPIFSRPGGFFDGQQTTEHLSAAFLNIYNENMKIKNFKDNDTDGGSSYIKAVNSLYFHIYHMYDNTDCKNLGGSNGEVLKGIRERLYTKKGVFRENVNGKRVDQCGRSIAAPSKKNKFSWATLPEIFRKKLTFPEKVTHYNYNRMREIFNNLECNFITIGSGKDKGKTFSSQILKQKYNYEICVGDVIKRWGRPGDTGFTNRQPTLHKNGFCGHKIKYHKFLTITQHSSETTPYNADYDGDEFNFHMNQSNGAVIESLTTANITSCIMSNQSSKPLMGLVFNCPLSAYLLSKYNRIFTPQTWDEAIDYVFENKNIPKLKSLRERLQKHDIQFYSNKALISVLFPEDFFYNHKKVKIVNGILIEGVLDKSHVGSGQNSIIHVLSKIYPKQTVVDFFTEGQFLFDWFISYVGFSIGYGDCIFTKKNELNIFIKSELLKAKIQIDSISNFENIKTQLEKENYQKKIVEILDNATNNFGRFIDQNLSKENKFMQSASSGSKGSITNLTQIMGPLGLQKVSTKPINRKLNNKTRVISYFPCNDRSVDSLGYISNSFESGLSPSELFFHGMVSREGVLDTASNTPAIGAEHRNLTKVFEDTYLDYNGSILNRNKILSFSNLNNLATKSLIPVKIPEIGLVDHYIDFENIAGILNN